MRKTSWSDREVSQIIERQMRNWEIARTQKAEGPVPEDKGVKDFVAVSRAVGLPGLKISSVLGEKLGWPVFVKQVLQTMAGDDEYRKRVYAAMDGRDLLWLEEIVRAMGFGEYGQDDYFRRLTGTILSIARTGNAVFLGRAADLILPKNAGFRIRLTASKDYCLRCYAEYRDLPPSKAKREVEEIETERAKFIRHHFRVDPDDPTRYDLVVSMERFSEDQTIALIMSALHMRGIGV